MLPKITKLSQAQAIVDHAAKYPLVGFDEHGNICVNGDRLGHFYAYELENGWCIAHYVYGGDYGRGASKKEALLAFIENNQKTKQHIIELKQWRKKAQAIVEKYSCSLS